MIREPAVAGQFYPGTRQALTRLIDSMVEKNAERKKAIAVVSPHAGYIYSGPVAAAVFSQVEITDTVVILGPNHTGIGHTFSIYRKGGWRTPLGDANIDTALADNICSSCKVIREDERAHIYEHSLEVEIPFMQYFRQDFRIVPIVLGVSDPDSYSEVARAIASAIRSAKKDILIVASSDMTHYEPQESAEKKDKLAIDAVLNLDGMLLLQKVEEYDISMCGAVPVAVMLMAAKGLGAKKAKLVKYQTSGETSGDYSAVVGYAGITVE